ncbi:hypothetical protein D6745_00415 [Candidatus Woesearchaeota archaeon]|nr:MAG: hypothetical protein D6745_00415 [Candidatus Woesearchaeota archaeon]
MLEIINLILITLLPFLELRASIPYGILNTDLGWPLVFAVCVATNIILGILVYLFINYVIHMFLRFKLFRRLYDYYVLRTQKKIRSGVEKYGEWAIAIFIGIPLPGSGVYSGAIASEIIGLRFKKFVIATVIGVLIAGAIVTVAVLSGKGVFQFFVKY